MKKNPEEQNGPGIMLMLLSLLMVWWEEHWTKIWIIALATVLLVVIGFFFSLSTAMVVGAVCLIGFGLDDLATRIRKRMNRRNDG